MIARSSVPGEPRQGAEIGVVMELEAAAAKPIQRRSMGHLGLDGGDGWQFAIRKPVPCERPDIESELLLLVATCRLVPHISNG